MPVLHGTIADDDDRPRTTRSAWAGASAKDLRDLEALSRLLDSAFEIPILRWRFGLDPILGLLPGVGDTITSFMSLYVLAAAMRLGVPRIALMRMTLNIAVDYIVGALPFVGDLFDVWWKSNQRNFQLLERHLAATPEEQRKQNRNDWVFLIGMMALLIAILIGSLTVAFLLARAIFSGLGQLW
jgi:hypothetical protein